MARPDEDQVRGMVDIAREETLGSRKRRSTSRAAYWLAREVLRVDAKYEKERQARVVAERNLAGLKGLIHEALRQSEQPQGFGQFGES